MAAKQTQTLAQHGVAVEAAVLVQQELMAALLMQETVVTAFPLMLPEHL